MKKTEFFKINWSMLVLLTMAVSLLTISACNDDDDDPDPDPQPTLDIVETAQGETTLSTLVTALTEANLVATLQGEGPFTVFAPTNEAFSNLPTGILDYLLANPTELASILQYHVVEGKVLSTDLSTGPVTTLNGTIQVVVSGGDVTLNGVAEVETADVEATNGVVHIIDEVLIPADFDIPVVLDIVETAQDTDMLSTLVTAVTEAELVATLQGDGPFTVFAPTNDAFDDLPDGVLEYLLANPDELTKILKYHVVDGSVLSTALTTGPVTALSGVDIDVDVSGGSVILNGSAEVITADVEATNGVVHIIDEVLIPDGFVANDIVQVALAADGLDSLVKALTLFPDLVETLGGTGNFTVFAPTNDAFVTLLDVIGQEQLTDIPESVVRTVLEYHVIAGAKIKSTDLTQDQTATTVAGEDIEVDLNGGVFISGAEVSTADVPALNGVIHIVDDVLVPPSMLPIVGTIVAPAFFNKDFTTLIAAVQAASPSILETLLGNGPGDMGLTLFAPTNAAFEAAGITELPDAATLDDVLTYHVIDGTVPKAGLPATGSAVTTLNGDFYLSINDDGVFINGLTEVIATDIEGTNGVVHVIDRTLLPASSNVVQIAVAAAEATEGAEFTQLVAALTAVTDAGTDLIGDLSDETANFTVFAPTDAAFQILYDSVGDVNMDGSNDISDLVEAATLTNIATTLQYHVLGMRVFSTDIPNALAGNPSVTLSPLAGGTFDLNESLTITATDGVLSVGLNDAEIVNTDILGTNGVIHVIDQVLLP